MNKNRTNILVCGIWWSGSSAMVDYLREFYPVNYVHGEFNDFRSEGRIGDQIEFDFYKVFDFEPNRIQKKYPKFLMSILRRNLLSIYRNQLDSLNKYSRSFYCRRKFFQLHTDLLSETNKEIKIKKAKLWIENIGDYYSDKETRFILFDQPLYLDRHEGVWPSIFTPFKLIIVIRDPRDQACSIIKRKKFINKFDTNLSKIYGYSPDGYMNYLNDVILNGLKISEQIYRNLGKEKVMIVSFEELVQNFDQTSKKINKFTGLLNSERSNPGKYFNPEESMKNVEIYKKYRLNILEDKLEESIAKYFSLTGIND